MATPRKPRAQSLAITLLGRRTELPASPEAAVLERLLDPFLALLEDATLAVGKRLAALLKPHFLRIGG